MAKSISINHPALTYLRLRIYHAFVDDINEQVSLEDFNLKVFPNSDKLTNFLLGYTLRVLFDRPAELLSNELHYNSNKLSEIRLKVYEIRNGECDGPDIKDEGELIDLINSFEFTQRLAPHIVTELTETISNPLDEDYYNSIISAILAIEEPIDRIIRVLEDDDLSMQMLTHLIER